MPASPVLYSPEDGRRLAITAIISLAHLDATVREGSRPGRSEQAWRNFLARESGTFIREAA